MRIEIDRRSHLGIYELVNGRPRNPIGRTGITGRGQLGKWGPNHAADPIVTRLVFKYVKKLNLMNRNKHFCFLLRWKRDEKGNKIKNKQTNKYVLQFVSIRRLDTNAWAIPGVICLFHNRIYLK